MSCCDTVASPVGPQSDASASSSGGKLSFDIFALIIAAFIAGNTTIATLAINLSETPQNFRSWFQLALLATCVLVALLLSPQILRHAFANLQRRRISVDLLFSMGAFGALAFSVINFYRGEGPVYFEVFNVLLVIYSLGAFVKRKAQTSVLKSIEGWKTSERTCQVIDSDGTLRQCLVQDIAIGDRVLVPSGNLIPVDGKVASGKAFVKESVITGEPYLRSVALGDQVHATSLATDAALEVEATSRRDDSVVDHIQRSLHEAISNSSRWQSSADRVSRWFTPFVAAIALLTFTGWSFVEGPTIGTMTALSVLLVACPCAFGFATPIAVWVCASRLASLGWRANTGEAMEKLAEVDTVVFDKTGTLTVMRPSLSKLILRQESRFGRAKLLRIASSLQSQTSHPIASAFSTQNNVQYTVRDSEPIAGVGIRGSIEHDNERFSVEIGRMEDLHRPCCDAVLLKQSEKFTRAGSYAVSIRIDNQLESVAIIDERPVDCLETGLRNLNELGLQVYVYSGDQSERVAKVGVENYEGNLTPGEKADRVRSLIQRGHRVLFIGDGSNDSVAMSQSQVSAAVAGGADLASSVADFEWQRRDLRTVAEAISVARRSTSRLRQTLLFSLCYNTIGMMVAASGLLHPVVAVLLMMSASLTVALRAADVSADSSNSPRYRPSKSPLATDNIQTACLPPDAN